MTFSSTDPRVPDERARSRASLSRLVAALLLGLAAVTGATLESTSSFLTDQVTVDVGVTTAPDFASTPTPTAVPAPIAALASIAAPASVATPTPTATPTLDAAPSTPRKGRG
ncbi:MAG TPA: hypothetical protein VFC48_11290 [Cellulomonas sp.]|nr:hypothetical protein [Cellulomonas sp.]